MNLGRFGLLKNSEGVIEPEGRFELVEISEREAQSLPNAYKWDSAQELVDRSRALGASISPKLEAELYFERFDGPYSTAKTFTPIPPSRKRKYVKHEKKTSKDYIKKTKKRLGLLELSKPILRLTADEVLSLFPKRGNPEKLDKNRFARNVVWYFYQQVQDGKPPEFTVDGCNMRTIFYFLKPILTGNKIFTDNTEKTKKEKEEDENDIDSFYGNFTNAVQKLVLAGLISYKDFNIIDDRKEYRFLPPARFNTHILLLAEKKAYHGKFVSLASKYGVMSQISRGRSTVLMTDTMLTEMFELGYDFTKNLSVLSFCDFDPVGTSIPFHFFVHLKKLGFYNVNHFEQYGNKTLSVYTGKKKNGKKLYKKVSQIRPCLDIVNPHDFEAEVRNLMRHKLKGSLQDDPSTKEWALITGGVTGTGKNTVYAISAEQFLTYVKDELDKKIRPLLTVPPEEVGLSSRLRLLTRAFQRHVGVRALLKAKGQLD